MRGAVLLFCLLVAAPALAGPGPRGRRAPAPAASPSAPSALPPSAPQPAKPAIGTAIRVVVQVGSLVVEELGHVVPCSRDAVCAVVSSGKHLEGQIVDGRLLVVSP